MARNVKNKAIGQVLSVPAPAASSADDADAAFLKEEEAFRGRLRQLLSERSQAEIARRTHTPIANVNRYLKGTTVPTNFCRALVKELGVNPAWLLVGEGAPYLSDVAAHTATMAGDLLELVQAMNTVARMRLGALAGKDHMRVLRELNDSVTAFEAQKTKLNAQTKPVFEDLIGQLRDALRIGRLDRARDLMAAAEQASRLCEDERLHRMFTAQRAFYEFVAGNAERAIEFQRQVFAKYLPASSLFDEAACIEGQNLVLALLRTCRVQEARTIARAALALAEPVTGDWYSRHNLCALEGLCDIDLGRPREGLARIQGVFPRLRPEYKAGYAGAHLRGLLLTGNVTFTEALGIGPESRGKSTRMLRYACWLEDAGALKSALDAFVGGPPFRCLPDSLHTRHAEALHAALAARAPAASTASVRKSKGTAKLTPAPDVKTGLESLQPAQLGDMAAVEAAVAREVAACQVMRLGGNQEGAVAALFKADDVLNATDKALTIDVVLRAIHWRNALALASAKGDVGNGSRLGQLAATAGEFFASHAAQGYFALKA